MRGLGAASWVLPDSRIISEGVRGITSTRTGSHTATTLPAQCESLSGYAISPTPTNVNTQSQATLGGAHPRTMSFAAELRTIEDKLHMTRGSFGCPGSHALASFQTPAAFGCDVCGAAVPPFVTMYGCRVCDWDACQGPSSLTRPPRGSWAVFSHSPLPNSNERILRVKPSAWTHPELE